jgi:hypothetical protein
VVGSIRRRLEQLEAKNGADESHTLPPEVDVVLALHQRYQARQGEKPVPPFTDAQLEELYRQDLEHTGPTLKEWRTRPGWTSEESQRLLDEMEEDALARLKEIDKGASLTEVYEQSDVDEEE